MKAKRIWIAMAVLALTLLAAPKTFAAQVLPGTVLPSGTSVTDPDRATDNDYLNYMELNVPGGSDTDISFVVDLEGEEAVSGVAIYGYFRYSGNELMLSDDIFVEAAPTQSGPWTEIGRINVGNTRPTDPDPTIGGVNPFTGGNGRMIPTIPTKARYLRINGKRGFDNVIRISHLQINPHVVIHELWPVDQGVAFNPFDVGGGANNSRHAVDLVDGKLNTRTFIGTTVSLVLDIGRAQTLREFRLLTSENDSFAMAETGQVWTSSTDDPLNFDTLETNWDASQPTGREHAVSQIMLPNRPTKRFYKLTLLTNRLGVMPNGTANDIRIGEIIYRRADELPLTTAAVVPGSVVDGTPGGGSEDEVGGFDKDYNRYFQIQQTTEPRGSFVIDLDGVQTVRSVGFYGNWAYLASQQMFSDAVTVEAGSSAGGPWTQIGAIDVGNTRPTDPDPAIGGVNPWTGGNSRIVPCTPTDATHLRIGFGYGFDNVIRVREGVVNPVAVLHEVIPVDQGQTLWDIGGGVRNTRASGEMIDGDLQTRANPKLAFATTLDFGEVKTVSKVRVYPWETDVTLLPTQGVIRTSSTDDPLNIDTDELNFNVSIIGGGVVDIELPSPVSKRYLQIDFTQTGRRIADIEPFFVDTSVPTVTIGDASTTITNSGPIEFVLTFADAFHVVDNVTLASSLTLAATGTASGTLAVTGSGNSSRTVTIDPISGEGTLSLSVLEGIAVATSANTNAAVGPGDVVTIDAEPPSVTIDQAVAQDDPATTLPLQFTAVFSEAVSDFDETDVNIGGTAGGTPLVVVAGGPLTFDIEVDGVTSGTVTLTIPGAAALDGFGNASLASTSTDNTVTYAPPPPNAAQHWMLME